MKKTEELLLRRKHMVIVTPKDKSYVQDKREKALVVSGLKNIQSLGFTFSKELFETLSHLSGDEFGKFYTELVPKLKKLVGADVQYSPMYPNFPTQVMEASLVELFVNAIIHYWTFGEVLPEYEKDERLPLVDECSFNVLSVGTYEDIMGVFSNLVSSKTSLSEQDKEDIKTVIKECADYGNYLPNDIPLKENVALIGKLIIEEAPVKSSYDIKKYFKTATDVLRLITAMSDGDISLATSTKYRNLKRSERKMILNLLAGCGDITEDLFRYHYEWIRIAEILHPSEYKYPKYNNINKAFNTLRNEHKPLMFGGKVQNAILKKDMRVASELLKLRPGEFARKLDKVVREAVDPDYIVENFKSVANEVSTPVLLQVRQHFIGRASSDAPIRVFFPKGNLARAKYIKNELPAISEDVCNKIVGICNNALIEQYKKKESLGNVYVDGNFKDYLVPFSQRSASKYNKTIVRGSKIKINKNAKAVRGFIWWTNTDRGERVDIDLSAAIYDEDWNYVEHVSYTNLRSAKYKACHSGDITNGGSVNGEGVAEFLDVDIDAVEKNAGRYIVYQVYNFTRQKFGDLPNCRFGWMEREDVNSGEIFEPTTVKMSIDLTADATVAIPVIFDCVDRKFIWCDMNNSMERSYYGGNNLESNLSGVTATCYSMVNINKPNLYDLVMLNAIARGNVVEDRNQADIIFSNDTTTPYEVITEVDEVTGFVKRTVRDKTEVPIITAFDLDYFMGELL
jgi:hypothetical protein